MRKTVGLLLSFAMIFSLAACSSSDASEKQGEQPDSVSVQSGEVQDSAGDNTTDMAEQYDEQRSMTQDTEQETERAGNFAEAVRAAQRRVREDFSATGTTKPLAEYAAEILGADIYEIIAEEPYTEADLAYYTGGRADQEQNDANARPAISGNVENMDSYDTILLGYPIWHGQAPRIISTFLESYDFSGKTIVPFCTSHSSGIGSSAANLHELCPDTVEWAEGRRFEAGTSKDTMEEWLSGIGVK